jgi:prefoldin subunit 5
MIRGLGQRAQGYQQQIGDLQNQINQLEKSPNWGHDPDLTYKVQSLVQQMQFLKGIIDYLNGQAQAIQQTVDGFYKQLFDFDKIIQSVQNEVDQLRKSLSNVSNIYSKKCMPFESVIPP